MTKIIYFADDEKNIRDLVVPFLEHDGFTVRAFETGDLLLEAYKNQKPDLVILDIMMPGTNGLDIMKSIRQHDNIPIIMLTARDSDVDFITAFNLGTDDYFTKPFSPIKLSLHVKALFKRLDEKAIKNDTQYQFLDLTLDTEKRIALLSNEEMPLTKTEFDFLLVLIENLKLLFLGKHCLIVFGDLVVLKVEQLMTLLNDYVKNLSNTTVRLVSKLSGVTASN
ncbi:Transcriptional regulator [Streptococcus agalactiae]|nr:Transcriptional regulator [Streptococcus agalactiae]